MNDIDLSGYEGHWVALKDNHVAGFGKTPDEALVLARHNRPKDKFVLQFVEQVKGTPLSLPPLLVTLRPFLLNQAQPIYLVGGAVRDILLGRPCHDLDFVLPQDAIKLSFKLGNTFDWPVYPLDKERDTGRVVLADQNTTLDFAKFRGATLEADLRDRDFTINAMALPATAQFRESVIDPLNGQQDLADGVLNMPNPTAIQDDPVRALRAVRLAQTFQLTLSEQVEAEISRAASLLSQTSPERIRDEWLKILAGRGSNTAVSQLRASGLLAEVAPEIAQMPTDEFEAMLSLYQQVDQIDALVCDNVRMVAHLADVFYLFQDGLNSYLLREVDGGINGRILLKLAALFHRISQPAVTQTEARLRHLALSNQAIEHVKQIVRHQEQFEKLTAVYTPDQITRRVAYRYFLHTQNAGIDVAILGVASLYFSSPEAHTTSSVALAVALIETISVLFDFYFNQYDEVIDPPLVVNGRDLMQLLKIKAGPEIGRLLRLIKEEQAAGNIQTKEQALNFALRASN